MLTAAPDEALPLPVLASALVDALRAELLAMLAAVVALLVVLASFAGSGRDRADHRVGRLRAAGGAAGGADIDVLQRLGRLPVARRHLHDDMVLVLRAVDGRDLALAECVIQRVVDLAGADAQPACGGAVDHQVGFQALLLLVGIDVAQHRVVLQRGQQLRRPFVQHGGAVGLQGVLVGGVALPAADADVLDRHQEQPGARHHRQFAAQPGDHLVDAGALRQRFQGDEDLAGIGLTAATAAARAGETDHVLHGRIVLHDIHQLRQLPCIAWNEMLWSAWMPPIIRPVSCCGKKPFGTITYSTTFSRR